MAYTRSPGQMTRAVSGVGRCSVGPVLTKWRTMEFEGKGMAVAV